MSMEAMGRTTDQWVRLREELRMEIDEYGNKLWWLKGDLHRKDGPARLSMLMAVSIGT